MAVVPALDIQPGQGVLDLCAAPGGKASQMAALLQGQGLLVANDIYPGRMKPLAQNMERMGVTHALAVLEQPHALAKAWPNLFDRILVDAPARERACSAKTKKQLHRGPGKRSDSVLLNNGAFCRLPMPF